MERYTYFDGGKWRLKIGDTEYSGDWVDRLAAYEDTGLEPEELEENQNEAFDRGYQYGMNYSGRRWNEAFEIGYQSCLNYKGLRWDEAEELQRYREIGSIDRLRELAQADKADEIGKYRFYYCESEDEYLIGARLDTFYYARWDGSSFTWSMSRYLPWGKHVVAPETAWKEYTYPSEPKEIGMSEWFKGFLGKLTREAAEAALEERERAK